MNDIFYFIWFYDCKKISSPLNSTKNDSTKSHTPPERRKELQWIRFYRDLNKIQELQSGNDYFIINEVSNCIKELQKHEKQILIDNECALKRQKDTENQYHNLKSKFEGKFYIL